MGDKRGGKNCNVDLACQEHPKAIMCISQFGARYASGINVDVITEMEAREMLTHTCADRTYLRLLVAERCFRAGTRLN